LAKGTARAARHCLKSWRTLPLKPIARTIGNHIKKYIPKEKHVVSKSKTTHVERCNRDFRTHIKILARETVCFSKWMTCTMALSKHTS
jgi:IS1 family transposase